MNKPELSIIIVSYNTAQLTLECIESVFQQTHEVNFEIIVFDNNSSDDSVESFRSKFGDKIKLITSSQNLGFAAGNNKAAEHAKGKYILLLNPDTVIMTNAIDILVNYAKTNANKKMWGGSTFFSNGDLNPTSCWRDVSIWNLFCRAFSLSKIFKNSSIFNSESYGGWKRDSIREVDIISGCFLLLEKSLWKKLKGFDLEFFMYGEDADLCYRARKYGAKPTIYPDAKIIHYGGASEKIKVEKLIKLFHAKHKIILKYWSGLKYILGRLLMFQYPFNKCLVLMILAFTFKKYQQERDVWCNVVKRKKEWLK